MARLFEKWFGSGLRRGVVAATLAGLPLVATCQVVAAPSPPRAPAAAADRPFDTQPLGAGDAIRITVFQSPELSMETRLSESGTVTYPLLGTLQLGGRTPVEVEALIANGLKDGRYIREPQVSVVLQQVRSRYASVLGEVKNPGRFVLEQTSLKVSDLVAMAGGVSTTGADRLVMLGQRDGRPWRLEVDLPSVFRPASATVDPVVQQGDVVYVQRSPQVYIYGEVQKPGAIRMERDMTVMQGLATGGGLTLRGTERALRIHRREPGGRVVVVQPALDDLLRDGDVIFVRESLF